MITSPSVVLGRYNGGRLRDGTHYILSRDAAIEAVNYECAADDFGKVSLMLSFS